MIQVRRYKNNDDFTNLWLFINLWHVSRTTEISNGWIMVHKYESVINHKQSIKDLK